MSKNIKIKRIKNCFIAYIDILGFSNAAKTQEQSDLLCEMINYIENSKKNLQQKAKINVKYLEKGSLSAEREFQIRPRIFSISDSIFITVNLTNPGIKKFENSDNFPVFEHLQRIVCHIAYICILRGFLIRGCIGYSRELRIVGNSLVSDVISQLVGMEKDFSYPRVLMHDSIIDYFSNEKSDLYSSYCVGLLPFRTFFTLDSDGVYFLNWIGYFKIFKDSVIYDQGSHPSEDFVAASTLEEKIEEKLLFYYRKDLKIFSKWFWMKTYLSKVIEKKKSFL